MNKKVLIPAVAVAFLTIGVISIKAQDTALKQAPVPMAEKQLSGEKMKRPPFEHKIRLEQADRFAKDLGLSEEQKLQAKKIREAGREQLKPLMDEMKALREKMDAMREKNMQEFEKILTPEQKAKLEEMKTRRPHRGERRDRGPRDDNNMRRPGDHRGPHPDFDASRLPHHED